MDPGQFKEGDIVEAAVTFMAFPLAKDVPGRDVGYKLVTTLRGLTLVTSEYREVRSHILNKVLHNDDHELQRSKITPKVKVREPSRSRSRTPLTMTPNRLKRKYAPYSATGRGDQTMGEGT